MLRMLVFIAVAIGSMALLYHWAEPSSGRPHTALTELAAKAKTQPRSSGDAPAGSMAAPSQTDSEGASAAPELEAGLEQGGEDLPASVAVAQRQMYFEFIDGELRHSELLTAHDYRSADTLSMSAGVAVLVLEEGQQLWLRLLSDRKESLHLHGYDEHLHVHAGEEASLKLILSHSGRFEVELHGSHQALAVLEVMPAP